MQVNVASLDGSVACTVAAEHSWTVEHLLLEISTSTTLDMRNLTCIFNERIVTLSQDTLGLVFGDDMAPTICISKSLARQQSFGTVEFTCDWSDNLNALLDKFGKLSSSIVVNDVNGRRLSSWRNDHLKFELHVIPEPESFPLRVSWPMVPMDRFEEQSFCKKHQLPDWIMDDALQISLVDLENTLDDPRTTCGAFDDRFGKERLDAHLSRTSGVLRICGQINQKPKVHGKGLVFLNIQEIPGGTDDVGRRPTKLQVMCDANLALSPETMKRAANAKKGQLIDVDGVIQNRKEANRETFRFTALRLWLGTIE